MSADQDQTQPIEGSDAQLASVYDPASYVVQGAAIVPSHKRGLDKFPPVNALPNIGERAASSTVDELDEPEPLTQEPSLPEAIAEQIASEVVAEVADTAVEEPEPAPEPPPDQETDEAVGASHAATDPYASDAPPQPLRLTRRPRRGAEGNSYRVHEFAAVHAERVASMDRRTQILGFGIAAVAVLLGGGAVGSGLADSRSILVGIFCFGAPMLLQLVISAWLEETIRAVRAQDYLIALEAAINEHLDHRSVGFESWLRRPHSHLELPYRWVADFALLLSIATAVIGWESAHLAGVDFLWAVVVPAAIAGASRYWAGQTLHHLESESRRRLRLDP